jgi:hypothetical protein
MRSILLSSTIILGLVSHASAKGCPDAGTMKGYLNEFFIFTGSQIGKEFNEFTKNLDEKYKLELESPHIAMSSFIPELTLKEEQRNHKGQEYILCNYNDKGETLLSFLVKK